MDTHTDIRTLATVSISPRKESNVDNHQEGFTAQIPRLDHKYCLKSGQPTSALISPRTAYLYFYFFFITKDPIPKRYILFNLKKNHC